MGKVTLNGRVPININGEVDGYFKTQKGLRQGDPISPLLFNLVADALSEMLTLAKEAGHLEGVVPNLVPGGLTHLQYADDMILFLQNTEENILTVKFLLYCFEAMSGMKINYQKSEVFVIGVDDAEAQRIAEKFNCERGKFPMKYLGIPISSVRLTVADFAASPDKLEKRLATWKCGHLSYGGKAILVNSSLTSIPMYTMGVYLLPETTHQMMDSIRVRFFWEGLENKRKYHMVKWEALCRPKEFGGLGFNNTRVMNAALRCKWIVRIESGQDDLCCMLLRRKYCSNEGEGGFFQSRQEGGSQFWKGLHAVKHWLRLGSWYEIGEGNSTSFWNDVWSGEAPLKVAFPAIYKACSNHNETVKQVHNSGEWVINLRRSLTELELEE